MWSLFVLCVSHVTCPVASVEAKTWKRCSKKSVEGKKEFAGCDGVVPGHVEAEAGRWGEKRAKSGARKQNALWE